MAVDALVGILTVVSSWFECFFFQLIHSVLFHFQTTQASMHCEGGKDFVFGSVRIVRVLTAISFDQVDCVVHLGCSDKYT